MVSLACTVVLCSCERLRAALDMIDIGLQVTTELTVNDSTH